MSTASLQPHWLDQYANNYHEWHEAEDAGRDVFYRPLGLIETAFDSDGLYYEGRADVNASLDLEISSNLSQAQLRERILLAWTALRLNHVLLMSRAVHRRAYMTASSDTSCNRFFLLQPPRDSQEAVSAACTSVVFVDDYYESIDDSNLYRHAQNCKRVVIPDQALAKLFVLPIVKSSETRSCAKFLFVIGHQITDGLANTVWLSHFVKLMNSRIVELRNTILTLSSSVSIKQRLPLAQEDLYPRIPGSDAKRRWFWVLSLVLRHIRKPMPPAFPNPLRRNTPMHGATQMPRTYGSILDYSKTPPLNSYTVEAFVQKAQTQRLHRLCREAGASIGAGCFVLVAMVMMSLHESRNPDEPEVSRRPFIGSFPINPRPFFNHASAPDSMMLAFSDGILLPFLPSTLDFDGRFRLLVRQAHRQLGLYQKRPKAQVADPLAHMGSRGAGRVISMNYIAAVERLRAKLPEHLRDSLGTHNPQGQLAVTPNGSLATCGVSSIGRTTWRAGEYDVGAPLREGEDGFVADYRRSRQNVRARDGEFLVGIMGEGDCIHANVSFDGNALDEDMVKEWKFRMENMLAGGPERAKL
ncbi:hypothetical protein MBLNU459_g3025t1 [Dothideomycetes sp. NU459]